MSQGKFEGVEINKHTQILLTKLCTPKPSRFFCFGKWFDKVKKVVTFVFRMFAVFNKSYIAMTNTSTNILEGLFVFMEFKIKFTDAG